MSPETGRSLADSSLSSEACSLVRAKCPVALVTQINVHGGCGDMHHQKVVFGSGSKDIWLAGSEKTAGKPLLGCASSLDTGDLRSRWGREMSAVSTWDPRAFLCL